jgi:diguanylate cyclase
MAGTSAVRAGTAGDSARDLYERIGGFLFEHGLDPDPANFAFAHHLLADPEGPLARAVRAFTQDGARLTRRDVEALGGEARAIDSDNGADRHAEGLVAQTQVHVQGFADIVTAMRAETEGFGRDLAASAAAISRSADKGARSIMIDEVASITAAMLQRVRTAEARLESTTREANELRKKLEEARDNARRDPLTGLANRRAFEEAYAAQANAGAQLCIAVCDVDHFKSVNDRFGHAVGDRVLKAIGEALAAACDGQLVARYGGEEFAILFSGLSIDLARRTLDAARASVATKRYRLRESDERLGEITFSAGLTAARGESYTTVYQRADRLLYAAKTAGRNCLHVG